MSHTNPGPIQQEAGEGCVAAYVPSREESVDRKPPVAPVHPYTYELHGETRVDNYHWLRDMEHPEVPAYLESEHGYMEGFLASRKRPQRSSFRR